MRYLRSVDPNCTCWILWYWWGPPGRTLGFYTNIFKKMTTFVLCRSSNDKTLTVVRRKLWSLQSQAVLNPPQHSAGVILNSEVLPRICTCQRCCWVCLQWVESDRPTVRQRAPERTIKSNSQNNCQTIQNAEDQQTLAGRKCSSDLGVPTLTRYAKMLRAFKNSHSQNPRGEFYSAGAQSPPSRNWHLLRWTQRVPSEAEDQKLTVESIRLQT